MKEKFFYPLLTIVTCIACSWPFFGKYYFSPNSFLGAFGGDQLVLIYDTFFHTFYGNSQTLKNTGYPYGDLIYMTDGQGALSNLLRWIHQKLFSIDKYIVGIVNALNAWSVPVAAVLTYYILDAWSVAKYRAVIFAVLITLLGPQIIRLFIHYGLGYPFIIPMAVLWTIRKMRVLKFEKRDSIVSAILLFFTFNNPYVGISGASIIMVANLVLWVKYRNINFKNSIPLMVSLVIIATVFIYLRQNDPYMDRIQLQWGYFTYKANIEGLIAPESSFLDSFVKNEFGKGFNVQVEAKQNVGLVVVLAFLAWMFISIFRKRRAWQIIWPDELKIFFFGAVLIFLYTSACIFLPFGKEFTEQKLEILLMFKAVARIGWSVPFIISLGAVVLIDRMLNRIQVKLFSILITLFLASLWYLEINQYIGPHFKDRYHGNLLSKKELEEKKELLERKGIKASDFQAILLIPKSVQWSDNFRSKQMEWLSQFHSTQISIATALPIVNPFHSRVSTGIAAEVCELYANPLIEKSLHTRFPNKKDLLVVAGASIPLSVGEKYLMTIADTLYKEGDLYLLRLPIDRLNQHVNSVKSAMNANEVKFSDYTALIHESYEDQNSVHSYYGKGALSLPKGLHTLAKHTSILDSVQYEFMIWTHVDHLKYGMGKVIVEVKNADGTLLERIEQDNADNFDVHDEWICGKVDFLMKMNQVVEVFFETNRPLIVDEMILKYKDEDFAISNAEYMLVNGIRVKR